MRRVASFTLAVLASAPLAAAQQAPPQGATPAARAAVATEQGQPVVRVAEGRVTLSVRNVPLRWILNELTTQVRLAIQVGPGAGAELVFADFRDVPLEDALRQLLRH